MASSSAGPRGSCQLHLLIGSILVATVSGRFAPPTHYSFKIQPFSSLSKASIVKYTSDEFEAGNHKWKLSIYPNGNKKRDGEGHISITLALVDTTSLPAGWEVKAIFNYFIYDQFRDRYVSFTDAVSEGRRFHAMKTEWGKYRFIKLENFIDPSNGYLVDDSCTFGVEVFVLKQTRKEECLSLMEKSVTCTHTWKIKSFSSLTMERHESEAFLVGDHKWTIRLYPCGNVEGKGNSISIFLSLDNSTLPVDTKLFVRFSLRTLNQINKEHFEMKDTEIHFSPSCLAYGSRKYMSLAKLKDPKHGFLVDDTCIIEAQVTLLGIVSILS